MRHSSHTAVRCALIGLLLIGFDTVARPGVAEDLTPADAQLIAKNAYLYGFPIVKNYRTMYAEAVQMDGKRYKAPFNTIKSESELPTPDSATPDTPTVDVLHCYLWMDLRAEPLVLGMPEIEKDRYYSVQLIDLQTFNFAYIGSRTTGNGAGKYLIAGPGWSGQKPPGVDKVIRCDTEFALAIYRTQVLAPDDLNNVRQIQGAYTVQPLSVMLGEPAPEVAKIDFRKPDSGTAHELVGFFRDLNFALQFCLTDPSEKEWMARLATISVGPGKTFDVEKLAPELRSALEAGVAEGMAAVAAIEPNARRADLFGTRDSLKDDYLRRAVGAKVDLHGNSKEESMDSLYLSDADGKPLDGSEANYTLTFATGELPPVEAFWSLTMYDGKTQRLVANPIGRYLVNSRMLDSLRRGDDASVTLLVRRDSPGKQKEANWLPAPDGPFYLVLRLYWPKPAAWDGTWSPPLVRVDDAAQGSPEAAPHGIGTAQVVKPSAASGEAQPEMDRPTVWGEPTEVRVGIYVVDVDEVDSAQQSFAASVYYMAQWKNPLLRHPGPGPMHRGLTEVWNPRLTIVGQQNIWRSFPELVEISPEGECTYRQRVWGHFSQPLQLREFPMDEQVLSIHIVAAGLREAQVKMVPLVIEEKYGSGLADKFSVPDFRVLSWSAEPAPYIGYEGAPPTSGFLMQIHVARGSPYYVMKIIIPLCLIVIMSWVPRWIHLEQVGTNIGVSTTSFLTLIAYLFAITVLLPRVSYITRMDRFIFLSTLMVFFGLLHTVVNTTLLNTDKKSLMERVERWSRPVYPILLLVIVVVSFVV